MRYKLIAAAIIILAQCFQSVKTEEVEKQWGLDCPLACACSLSELRDLSIHRWFLEDTTVRNEVQPGYNKHNNEAHDEDNRTSQYHMEGSQLGLLKTAICVFQRGSEAEKWMNMLPNNVQVLTVLKAAGSGQLTLRKEHFADFASLIALEIQGSHAQTTIGNVNDNENPETYVLGDVVIMSDTLRIMTNLQYLHLQHVRLLGQPEVAPRSSGLDSTKYMLTNETYKEKNWKQKHSTILHELVFLTPTDPLPYDEYKNAQEVAGLSLFRGLSSLKFLRVYHCGLKEIRWEMFDGLTSLIYLSLENNELHFIPDFAFYGATNLKSLSLAHNIILNLQFTGLAGLLELEKLDLSYNNISHLSELSLPPLPKLKTIDFRHNPIERIYAATFEVVNNTATIYIGSNDKQLELTLKAWHGLSNLKRLSLFNVKATELEGDMLIGMYRLKELQIQGKIQALSFDAFSSLPKLEILLLKNCGIERISMDTFYGLHGLLALDLSYNSLTTLPPGAFDQLPSLKELYLQNNQLTELPANLFLTINAKMIRLDKNPWHCSCAMREWRPMQISKIKVIRNGLQFADQHSKSLFQVRDTQYLFEKQVAPKCKTPRKYYNWNVFHVLRKELRCVKQKGHQAPAFKIKVKEETSVTKSSTYTPTIIPEIKNFTVIELETTKVPLLLENIFAQTATTSADNISSSQSQTSSKAHDLQDNNPISRIPAPIIEEDDPNELQPLLGAEISTKLQKSALRPNYEESSAIRESDIASNSYTIQHQGQQIKISKKAYKLELARIRNEKLKKMQQ